MENTKEQSFEEWVVSRHVETNHFYDKKLNLPYNYHLTMAELEGESFKYLLPQDTILTQIPNYLHKRALRVWEQIVKPAIKGHDVIEDARASYNDVYQRSNRATAEIIRAVTNYGRGRDRDERMPDWIYAEIAETPFATFVKLCDRLANVKYSWYMQSGMFDKYKAEHGHFRSMLYGDGELDPMWRLLDDILKPTRWKTS